MRARLVVLSVAVLTLCACADRPRAGEADTGPTGEHAPFGVVLTCGVGRSTTLSSDVVRAQPDGVHLDVVNEYDEPVSVAGFDADPGRSAWVMTDGPGTKELMCWPFSQHGLSEPDRIPLTIVDPEGLYVDGSMTCEEQAGMSGSYGEPPVEEAPTPEQAREAIAGLLSNDETLYAGYPEQEQRPLVVVRDGEVIGQFEIARWEGRTWEVVSYSICADSDLSSAPGSG